MCICLSICNMQVLLRGGGVRGAHLALQLRRGYCIPLLYYFTTTPNNDNSNNNNDNNDNDTNHNDTNDDNNTIFAATEDS